MGVDSTHPLFKEHQPDWIQMRKTYRGERIIKEGGFEFLPPTSGMIFDGISKPEQAGFKAYSAYLKRARFPDLVREAVEALLGVMHHKPPVIELPPQMEFLREDATVRNESLEMLLRRVNEEQLVLGRTGLLADVADSGTRKDLPYISSYAGERIINWDEGRRDGIEIQNLNFVSLNETEQERIDDFEWEDQQKYRILLLTNDETDEAATGASQGSDNVGSAGEDPVANLPEGEGIYRMGVFRENDVEFDPSKMITPSIKGRSLNELPFVFINTKDITPEPDDPPLVGLSNLTLSIYRGEADYRQSLFMQGQDTLVVIGASDDDEHRTGAGASINIPTVGGDAKYIGVESSGLSEMRSSLENDYDRAGAKGGQLLDTVGGDQQSGEALRVRVAAKTATLNQIALAGAFGLETLLKIIGRWMGVGEADVADIKVIANLDFADDRMGGKELLEVMSAKQIGAPISLQSIHTSMQERGMTELTLEEEMSLIESEQDSMVMLAGPGASEEDGPEDDPGSSEEEEVDAEQEEEEQEVGANA